MYRGKRLFDVACAGILLLVLLPVIVLIDLLIRATSGAPVMFTQERVGAGAEYFDILKFRTMHVDAGEGPCLVSRDDDRVTRIGRILRRFHLDELPQLVNVLLGEMSMVGPRPKMLREYERQRNHIPEFDRRRRYRPGLTSPGALAYCRRDSPAEEREMFWKDVGYFEERASFFGDCQILLKTVWVVVCGNGR